MKNNASLIYAIFLLTGDFLALIAAFVSAYMLRFKLFDDGKVATIGGETFMYAIISILPIWLLIHAVTGLYRHEVYEKRFVELGRLLVGTFLGTLAIIGYDFLIEGGLLPGRLVPLYAFAMSYVFLVLFRTLARNLRRLLYRYGLGISNILIVGDTPVTHDLVQNVGDTKHTGLVVAGVVGVPSPSKQYYATFQDAIAGLKDTPIHGIIQTELYRSQEKNNEILRFAQTHHVSYRFVPGNSDLFIGNITVELFAGLPVIAVHQTALTGWGRVAKRIFDVLITLGLLVIAVPLMLMVALVMKLNDPRGDIFFRQTRLTRFNRHFYVYKFRTIRTDVNGLHPEEAFAKLGQPQLIAAYRRGGDYLSNDPRYGKLGNFLRSTSLDELPQLLNVIRGDISLVGPRALVPQELNTYEKKHAILSVKSGLTGLAQISGRRDLSFSERRKLDVYYVQNWSFWLDISILIRTIRAILRGTGGK